MSGLGKPETPDGVERGGKLWAQGESCGLKRGELWAQGGSCGLKGRAVGSKGESCRLKGSDTIIIMWRRSGVLLGRWRDR